MPELPEVEVVRGGLAPFVTGASVLGAEILDARSLKRHHPSGGDFEKCVTGRVLSPPARRGKFLWIGFVDDPDHALLAHLGMSGQLLIDEPGSAHKPLARILLHLLAPTGDDSHASEWVLSFVDQRLFGSLAIDVLVATADGEPGGKGSSDPRVPSQVAHIARDVLDPAFDRDQFERVVSARGSGIKRVLLDQGVISGIGNIYADEALWAAQLHYDQSASTLSHDQISVLVHEIQSVFERALAEGGTSFDSQYVNVNGRSGYFSRSLQAYGRTGEPCPRCGTPINRDKFMNRSSFYCPRCQQLR